MATKLKKADTENNKLTSLIIDKEDHISKLRTKISTLGTKDLDTLARKIVRKKDQAVQTDKVLEEDKYASNLTILDKLPPFNQRETGNGKPGKKFLNVNVVRGKHDECFNCHDLEKKIKVKSA